MRGGRLPTFFSLPETAMETRVRLSPEGGDQRRLSFFPGFPATFSQLTTNIFKPPAPSFPRSANRRPFPQQGVVERKSLFLFFYIMCPLTIRTFKPSPPLPLSPPPQKENRLFFSDRAMRDNPLFFQSHYDSFFVTALLRPSSP